MNSGNNYSITQWVIDVDNTVYENMVIVNGESVCDMQGLYQCSVQCHDDTGGILVSTTDSLSITGN